MTAFNRLKSNIFNLKINKQLYLIYLSVTCIPILFLGFFLMYNTRTLLFQHYQQSIETDNLRVKSIIFNITTNLFNISEEISEDSILQEILKKEYQNENTSIDACISYTKLDDYLLHTPEISSLSIYSSNPTLYPFKYFKSVSFDISQEDWYLKAISQPHIFWSSSKRIDNYNNEYWELALYKNIPLINSDYNAVLEIKLCSNYLKNLIQNNSFSTILSVNDDPIFWSYERNLQGTPFPFASEYNQPFTSYTGILPFKGENTLLSISSFRPISSDDWIYITTLDSSALKNINTIMLTCLLIVILALLLPLPIVILFTKYFSSRINLLKEAMHKVCNSEYEFNKTFTHSFIGDDELSQTFSDLQLTVNQILEKDAKMYKQEINRQTLINEQQKIEFKMLASQINPHFLYNTLETIRMKALKDGNRDVSTAIKLLGKSMHYVLENTTTSLTNLKKEVDYIDIYIAIQKLRFGDRINYTLHQEVDISAYNILPLLIQPLIENSIIHGFEGNSRPIDITLSISQSTKDLLSIAITDNGQGMSSTTLEKLNEALSSQEQIHSSSIGLYNINRRIKIRYGSQYGLKITSTINQGTTISLLLPLSKL